MKRRRPAPQQNPVALVPLIACPHCRGMLPLASDAYTLFAHDHESPVRLTVNTNRAVVYVDGSLAVGPAWRITEVHGMDTADPQIAYDPVLFGPQVGERLLELATHAWQRARDMAEGDVFVQLRRASTPRPAPTTTAVIGPDSAGEQSGGTQPDPYDESNPRFDQVFVKINEELDGFIKALSGETAPAYARDPVGLLAAVAQILHLDFTADSKRTALLAAAALVRLVRPLERHDLPPDPFPTDPEGPQ